MNFVQSLRRGEATIGASFLGAYMECSAPVQEVVREMIAIINDEHSDPEDVDAAIMTLTEALWPALGNETQTADEQLFNSPEFQAADKELSDDEEAFADRVRGLLKARGMTQDELAAATGITQPAVCNILQRNLRPQRRTVAKFAAAFGVEPQDLWPNY